jgi:predicted ferric reductase
MIVSNIHNRKRRTNMLKKTFYILSYFLSPVLLMIAIFISNPSLYSKSNFFISMTLGACAFTWLNFELILSARPKFIESSFGLDKFFRFHSLMAVIAIVLSFLHKLIKEDIFGDEGLPATIGTVAIIIFIGAAVLALIFMIDTVVKRVKPLLKLKKYLEKIKIGKYHIQVILHNATVIGVIVLFIHVMFTYSAKNLLVKYIYILYFGVSISFYLYHKVFRYYYLTTEFVVSNVKSETPTMWTITLKPVKGEIFKYKAGQFGFLRIIGDGISREMHPFSISSDPTNKKFVTVTVKKLGDWTSTVGQIKAGDKAILDAPYGRFSPQFYNSDKPTVLIAGGVGITPMLSIMRYFYKTDKNRSVMLFWGLNDLNELLCKKEFDEFQSSMKNFTFVPVIANDKAYKGEQGFITSEKIERIIKARSYEMTELEYFVCGPPLMQTSVLKSLKTLGIKRKNIHYENFSL